MIPSNDLLPVSSLPLVIQARLDALSRKLDDTLTFCAACRQAWQGDDLDEMIRQRDRLEASLKKRAAN